MSVEKKKTKTKDGTGKAKKDFEKFQNNFRNS